MSIEEILESKYILEFLPVLIIGLLSGTANFCRRDSDDLVEANWKDFFYQFSSSVLLCGVVYAILDATDLSYMTRWAIAGAVSFYGVDKALDIVQRIINLRNPNNPKSNERRDYDER